MCKITAVFILLSTGYLYNSMVVTEDTPTSLYSSTVPTSRATQASELETTLPVNHQEPEGHPVSPVVAGISISLCFLLVLVIIGVWYARKRSMAEINSVPSDEPGVSLKTISVHEN